MAHPERQPALQLAAIAALATAPLPLAAPAAQRVALAAAQLTKAAAAVT